MAEVNNSTSITNNYQCDEHTESLYNLITHQKQHSQNYIKTCEFKGVYRHCILYILTVNKNWPLIISKENYVCMGYNNKSCKWDPIKNELRHTKIFSIFNIVNILSFCILAWWWSVWPKPVANLINKYYNIISCVRLYNYEDVLQNPVPECE